MDDFIETKAKKSPTLPGSVSPDPLPGPNYFLFFLSFLISMSKDCRVQIHVFFSRTDAGLIFFLGEKDKIGVRITVTPGQKMNYKKK